MSDVEENTVPASEEVEVSADAAPKGQMSVLDALKGVLKISLMHDGLARGLREASKALDRREAHMCVLNESCEEEAYKKLVIALCSEHKIPLIKVPDGKQLGEWAGLCVLDREGNARKVVNCSCVVVKNWGEMSSEREVRITPESAAWPQLLTNDTTDPPQLLPDRAVNWRFASWRGGIPRDVQAADASRTLALTSHVSGWTYAWVDLTDWHKCLEQALTGFPARGNKQRKRSKTHSLIPPMTIV
ncbi:ribosomal protein L7Ae/L30e/S12e/Gadd45 family-domain-containing protein [Neurospora tetraspora]|uniref:40S ribosomal protein S12 n=1 Tax=Neurospora tetraspora TaxID=94610 RepID=A0AAE0JAK4_9PEZI|nr:ribosomal protein L7Ae/L30e/S12e/Gadd45 family-domain-containing protein [Neurospora tetraspora]